MRKLLLLLSASLAFSPAVLANHNCPNVGSRKAWVVGFMQYEFDPQGVWLGAVTDAFNSQGYPVALEDGFWGNYLIPQQTFCGWDIQRDTDGQFCEGWSPLELLTTFSHGGPHGTSHEVFTKDLTGETTRNRRWDELRYWYHPGPNDPQIVKTAKTHTTPEWSYWGIAVTPHFYEAQFDANPHYRYPDFMHVIGCSTAVTEWRVLNRADRVRCLILLRNSTAGLRGTRYYPNGDTIYVPWQPTIPYFRLAGRQSYEVPQYPESHWENDGVRRFRTVPNAFRADYRVGTIWYTMDGVFDVNFAGIDKDSLALAPMMTGTNIQEYTTLPEYDSNECYGSNLPVWMTFSAEMYAPNPGYRVSGSEGAWAGCEAWESFGGIPNSKLTAKLASVYMGLGDIIVRAKYPPEYGDPSLRSAEGNHPFWKPGLGVAGTDWEVPMTCMYTAQNYATAYGPCPSWRENGKVVLWLEGVENSTQRHLVYGGTASENLRLLTEIPGSGQKYFRRDELVDLPGDISYVRLVEEPDGSETRVQEVMDQEPPQHQGWVHQSGPTQLELNPPRPDPHRFDLPDECPDWVFYGPSWLLNEVRSSEFERILREQYYDGLIVYLDAPDREGWTITEYATQCKETFGRIPDFCIVGSGCDVPEYAQNLVSPWKEPGCPGCYFYDHQSGDAQWGVLDPDWRTNGWNPEAFITRIPAWDVASFWRHEAIATSRHDQANTGQAPNRVLALLGDELEGGIDPAFVNEYWTDLIRPRIVDDWDCSVVELRDTGFPNHTYYLSHQAVADRMNSSSAWPGIVYLWGVVSNFIRTPGYLIHTYQGSYPWDGSLLTPGLNHHFIAIGPGCGMADIWQWTAWRPSLLEMFMFNSNGKAGMAAAQLCTRGGGEQDHRKYAEIQSYWVRHTVNTFQCHKKVLQTWALLYPEAYHYGMGIIHLGLPMIWGRGSTGVEEEQFGELGFVRCTSPSNGAVRIAYSLPPLPASASAELRIVDVTGRCIRSLKLASSEGSLTWDSRDSAGKSVGSGMYFLALTVNGHKFASNRVVLVD